MKSYLRKPGLNLNLNYSRTVLTKRPKFFTLSPLNKGHKCTKFERNLKGSSVNHLMISHGITLLPSEKQHR